MDRTGRGEDAGDRICLQTRLRCAVLCQILGHIADADYLFCSAVLGEKSPSPGVEKTRTTKAELVSALHDAFAYCGRAYETLTDASASETVKAFGQERNKLGVLWFNSSHNLEHYGNLVVYLRLKGIVPPSTDPNPQ